MKWKMTVDWLSGTPPAERLFLAPTTEQAELTTETLTHNHQQYMVKIARNKLKGK